MGTFSGVQTVVGSLQKRVCKGCGT